MRKILALGLLLVMFAPGCGSGGKDELNIIVHNDFVAEAASKCPACGWRFTKVAYEAADKRLHCQCRRCDFRWSVNSACFPTEIEGK